jgi:uncharacterized membrane protein
VRGHRDLRLLAAATLVCAIGSLITPLGPVRAIFAVPLTLIFPGYAVTAAAFGARLPAWPERLPLTLGVSLACLALASIVLNYVPGGIHGFPWTIILVVIVLASCRTAARRRRRTTVEFGPFPSFKPSPATAVLAVGSLAAVVAALILAQNTVTTNHVYGYTQLWIEPPRASDGPAQIGITSEQQQTRAYRLMIEIEGESDPLKRTFELEPGETRMVTVPIDESAGPVGVEARLYLRGRQDKAYRRVSTQLR